MFQLSRIALGICICFSLNCATGTTISFQHPRFNQFPDSHDANFNAFVSESHHVSEELQSPSFRYALNRNNLIENWFEGYFEGEIAILKIFESIDDDKLNGNQKTDFLVVPQIMLQGALLPDNYKNLDFSIDELFEHWPDKLPKIIFSWDGPISGTTDWFELYIETNNIKYPISQFTLSTSDLLFADIDKLESYAEFIQQLDELSSQENPNAKTLAHTLSKTMNFQKKLNLFINHVLNTELNLQGPNL